MNICGKLPALVEQKQFEKPSRCKSDLFHVWGEFDVPDDSCRASFDAAESGGLCEGKKRWSRSYLVGIPKYEDPMQLCKKTTKNINGMPMSPTKCVSYYTGTAGEFLVDDSTCPDKEIESNGKPQACNEGVSVVVGDNGTTHALSVWTWDLTQNSLPKLVVKQLASGARFSISGDALPPDGHIFQTILLDLTAVATWNKDFATGSTTFKPLNPESTGQDGAIYDSKFYSSEVLLASCKSNPVGFSMIDGRYYPLTPGRALPGFNAIYRRKGPWREVSRPPN